MTLKQKLNDYTEQEFLEFILEIKRANKNEPDDTLIPLIQHFETITEHPSGSDLFYWPESEYLSEPEQILKIVKEWRLENGKEGFKAT